MRATSYTARALCAVIGIAASTVVSASPPTAADEPVWTVPDTVLVSATAAGVPANRPSDRPRISGDGRYVTFDSTATNLVPGGAPYGQRAYRKDLLTGALELVSVSDAPDPSTQFNSFTWPDQTGNLVAFVSDTTNLGTTPSYGRNVFVRDMAAGVTETISVSWNGVPVNGASSRPMITRNGRYVAFSSFGSNVTTAGGNGQEQVYVRDRVAGTTTLISNALGGGIGNGRSYRGLVSEDGRYVVWASTATNLVSGPQVNGESIFLRDVVSGTTTRVSTFPNGYPAFGARPYMSPDARSIVFNTYSQIDPADTDLLSDLYTYDRTTGLTVRESVPAAGTGEADDESLRGFVSDDSRYFVFNSFSPNIAPNDTNGRGDAFLRDRTTGEAWVVSRSFAGSGGDAQSFRPVPDAAGAVITYLSEARNLVRNDTSVGFQVYAVTTASVLATQPDSTRPTATVTSPAGGATVIGSSITLGGTAADDRGVDRAFVQLRNDTTGQWLRPDGTWGATAQRVAAPLAQRYATSTTWQLTVPLTPGRYRVEAGSIDTGGNVSTSAGFVTFTMTDRTPDTVAPTVSVTAPAGGSIVGGPSVSLRGATSDDTAVTATWVQVRDNTSNLWLRADGTWGSGARRLAATLGAGAWSLPVSLPDGSYGFDVQSYDAAGNASAKPWTSFRVRSTPPDTTAPSVAVTGPTAGSTVPRAVTFSGTGADDVAVTAAYVQVRNNTTNEWLRPDGTWGTGARRINATLTQNGGGAVSWSLSATLPTGSFGFDVQLVDAAGNASVKPWTNFKTAAS